MTGGDGTVAFIYTPPDAYGYSVPAASISGADLTLPEPVPVEQLYNVDDGWLTKLYLVVNDDGFFGKIDADPEVGEIEWQTTGTPGTPGWRTNGRRYGWKKNNAFILPTTVLDSAGRLMTGPQFSGTVTKIRFSEVIPLNPRYGAYFLSLVGRISLKVRSLDNGFESNSILLHLEPTLEVIDESVAGYLQPDIASVGRLNANRLGGARRRTILTICSVTCKELSLTRC